MSAFGYVPWTELAEATGFEDWREMLVSMYQTHGTQSIADKLGVDRGTVRYHLRRMGVKPHAPGGDQTKRGRL